MIVAGLLVCGAASAGTITQSLTQRQVRDPRQLETILEDNFAEIDDRTDGTTDQATLGVTGVATFNHSIVAVSTNDTTTNTIVNTDGQVDGETLADDTIDEDSLDFGTNTDQVAASDLPDEDIGDMSISSGSFTLDNDVVAAAEVGVIAQTDTNANTVATGYTPDFIGQILKGLENSSNKMWCAQNTTTNGWVVFVDP